MNLLGKREVSEYSERPRGYGAAWWSISRRSVICYPMPLNRVMGTLHWVYLWLIAGRTNRWERMLSEVRESGWDAALVRSNLAYTEGYQHGEEAGRVRVEISREGQRLLDHILATQATTEPSYGSD